MSGSHDHHVKKSNGNSRRRKHDKKSKLDKKSNSRQSVMRVTPDSSLTKQDASGSDPSAPPVVSISMPDTEAPSSSAPLSPPDSETVPPGFFKFTDFFKTLQSSKWLKGCNPDETIVFFDVDDTLLTFASSLYRDIELRERICSRLRTLTGDESAVEDFWDAAKLTLVDINAPAFIDFLQSSLGFTCIGFTARRTGFPSAKTQINVQERTVAALTAAGIFFKSPIAEPEVRFDVKTNEKIESRITIDQTKSHGALIHKGTIFTANMPKRLVLSAFFDLLKKEGKEIPKHVVLFDDNVKNLVEIKGWLDSLKDGPKFIGFHSQRFETVFKNSKANSRIDIDIDSDEWSDAETHRWLVRLTKSRAKPVEYINSDAIDFDFDARKCKICFATNTGFTWRQVESFVRATWEFELNDPFVDPSAVQVDGKITQLSVKLRDLIGEEILISSTWGSDCKLKLDVNSARNIKRISCAMNVVNAIADLDESVIAFGKVKKAESDGSLVFAGQLTMYVSEEVGDALM